MDEEVFNIQLRKFLKKVGIQSQREIEQAVRDGIASGALQGNETLKASVRLQLSETGLDVTIEDDIKLA
jgi:hypothetical protein